MKRKNEAAKRYRVAFSYASDNRPLVGRAATVMADLFGKTAVLYEKFHEGDFARHNLADHLRLLYQEESRFVVVVICPNYQAKTWTGLEWNAILEVIHARQKRKTNEVMLCRFNQETPEGLEPEPGPGFVELDRKTPWQFAQRILEGLAESENKNRDHYLHRLYVRWSWHWLAIGIIAPLLALALYPVSMRVWPILLSAVLMGTLGIVVNVWAIQLERVAPVFRRAILALAVACAALFVSYRQTVVRVEGSPYVTGSTTVPASKSPDCACPAGSSAAECARGATSDAAMDACFGANRMLFAKGLLLVLYLAATSALVATVELGRLARNLAAAAAIRERAPRREEKNDDTEGVNGV